MLIDLGALRRDKDVYRIREHVEGGLGASCHVLSLIRRTAPSVFGANTLSGLQRLPETKAFYILCDKLTLDCCAAVCLLGQPAQRLDLIVA